VPPETAARRRVLLLSASVGEGHDAAAQAVAAQLRAAGADAELVDGLALLGPRLARFVIRGYGIQLRRALASLRRRGRLPVTCASLITDFDPHPGWSHPDLDANLSVASNAAVTSIAPPLRAGRSATLSTDAARRALGAPLHSRTVLIAGGAWGVGNLRGAALAVTSLEGFHAIVVTGRNDRLRCALSRELAGRSATVLGYVDGLGALLAGADVVVQHAGGVTCLEAFAAARPVVMFDAIAGHGRRNARRMEDAGLATNVGSARALRTLLGSDAYWSGPAPTGVAAGLALFARPEAAAVLAGLAGERSDVAATQRMTRPQSTRTIRA
jgi:processive 1,2-diacylglycerol beta-glucosyltransferase